MGQESVLVKLLQLYLGSRLRQADIEGFICLASKSGLRAQVIRSDGRTPAKKIAAG